MIKEFTLMLFIMVGSPEGNSIVEAVPSVPSMAQCESLGQLVRAPVGEPIRRNIEKITGQNDGNVAMYCVPTAELSKIRVSIDHEVKPMKVQWRVVNLFDYDAEEVVIKNARKA